VYKLLKDNGMRVYKECLTTNNNESLRDEFFRTPIIRQIWEKLAPKITLKDFFGTADGFNEKIIPTYSEISRSMK
jgi:hypothetical protein